MSELVERVKAHFSESIQTKITGSDVLAENIAAAKSKAKIRSWNKQPKHCCNADLSGTETHMCRLTDCSSCMLKV